MACVHRGVWVDENRPQLVRVVVISVVIALLVAALLLFFGWYTFQQLRDGFAELLSVLFRECICVLTELILERRHIFQRHGHVPEC